MLNRLRRIRRDTRGVAAIEFALMLPMLIALLIGSVEVTFKIWSTQKAEKLAVTISDIVAQATAVKEEDLVSLTDAVDKIMDPFPFGNNEGRIVISSIYVEQDETIATVNWQCFFPPTGGLNVNSAFGVLDADADLPTGFTLAPRDNVIVAEVFYRYHPIAPGLLFDESTVYRRALFKPRLGTLISNPCEDL